MAICHTVPTVATGSGTSATERGTNDSSGPDTVALLTTPSPAVGSGRSWVVLVP
ncbi:MAG: hypothetical protein LBR33_01680 [Propionibacteriaceae bacterium]|nr:hypothetical protein [Propionibacteriaceae bacterium]